MSKFKLITGLLFSTLAFNTTCYAQALREDFNTLDELKTNWSISQWASVNGADTIKSYVSENVQVQDGKLVLKVNASPPGVYPKCGEVTFMNRKFLYGSYRASIKTTNVPGSVIGWFLYKDGVPGDGNLHEVDFEILTRQHQKMWFTLHHDAYSVDSKTYNVSFNPWEAYHEYRFDWYKDSVVYYIDGIRINKLTNKVPDDSTAMMLNHWSSNNPGWGGAAPLQDTYMYVDYVEYQPLPTDTTTALHTQTSPIVQRMRSGIQIQLQAQSTAQVTLTDLKGSILGQYSIADRALIPTDHSTPMLLRIKEAGHVHTQFIAPMW